jgi:hypothetical protein
LSDQRYIIPHRDSGYALMAGVESPGALQGQVRNPQRLLGQRSWGRRRIAAGAEASGQSYSVWCVNAATTIDGNPC